QVRNHREMEGHAVTLLEPTEVAEQCGELIDALIQLLVGDGLRYLVLRFRDPDEGGLVPVLRQVAVDTVIGGVQPTTDEPLPEGRVAGIERRVPVLVPGEEVGILLEALGEVLLPESVEDGRIPRIGLANKFGRRIEILLLPPMDGDLRLGELHVFRGLHCLIQPPSIENPNLQLRRRPPSFHIAVPTGKMYRPAIPAATSAAEVQKATAAVRTPTRPPTKTRPSPALAPLKLP